MYSKQLSNKTQDKWWTVTVKKINVCVNGDGIKSNGTMNSVHLPWSSTNVNWNREIWWKYTGNTQVNVSGCVCLVFDFCLKIQFQLDRHNIQFHMISRMKNVSVFSASTTNNNNNTIINMIMFTVQCSDPYLFQCTFAQSR